MGGAGDAGLGGSVATAWLGGGWLGGVSRYRLGGAAGL